jgi:hypothetical protein
MDKNRQEEAHPAYVRIIEQLSPVDAKILWEFGQHVGAVLYFNYSTVLRGTLIERSVAAKSNVPNPEVIIDMTGQIGEILLHESLVHLDSLGLLNLYDDPSRPISSVTLNLFGVGFCRTCLPKKL